MTLSVAATIATSTLGAPTTKRASTHGAPPSKAAKTDLAKKGCTAIKVVDAQAVVKAKVTKVVYDSGSAELSPTHSFKCWINNPTLIVTIHPEDASKQTYNRDVKAENSPAVRLPGVGLTAVWVAVSQFPGTYNTAPDVYAHRGAVTCEVQPSSDPVNAHNPLKISPIPGNQFGQVSEVADAAFAKDLGRLCNDVFAALK